MIETIKTTPLHSWHKANKASMAEFGGYEMPLWYSKGSREEHLSVLTRAGLFDTSHMSIVRITGRDAFKLLQKCLTKDLSCCVGRNRLPLSPGKCAYGAFLNENGWVVDDTLIYQVGAELYLAVVNAGMSGTVSSHIGKYASGLDVHLDDLVDKVGKIDIQGPYAGMILSKVFSDPSSVFEAMDYFTFKGYFAPGATESVEVFFADGTPVMVSRTGYTGEFGFELFLEPEHLEKTWETILKNGEENGLIPCGLAARDSLRAGAVLPLSHQDIGNWPFIDHPWEFALSYDTENGEFTKDFIGREALEQAKGKEFTYPFAGYDLRKVTPGSSAVETTEGEQLGKVLTCVTDIGIGRNNDRIYSINSPDRPEGFEPGGLSCGFIKVNTPLTYGTRVVLRDSKRSLEVEVVENIRPDRTARRPLREMLG